MSETRRGMLAHGCAWLGAGVALQAGGALAAAPQAAEWIVFERTDAGLVLPLTLNGVSARGILDNGASHTLVDAGLAEKAGVRPDGETATVRGWSNSAKAEPAEPSRFQISGFAATVAPLVLPLGPSGPPEPVLLGRNLFADKLVEIDFARNRLRILSRESSGAPAGFIRVSRPTPLGAARLHRAAGARGFRPGEPPQLFPVGVEGHPVEAQLDLGSNAPLHLSRSFVARCRLLEGRRVSAAMSGDVGGFRTMPVFTCAALGLGGATLRNVPAEVFDEPAERAVIGLQAISRFRIVLDMARADLWIRPEPQHLADPFAKNRAGLGCMAEGEGLEVVFVAPGSPAERAGWKAGEIIAKVDEAPARAQGLAWRSGPAGAVHEFTLADGDRRTLVLADYY